MPLSMRRQNPLIVIQGVTLLIVNDDTRPCHLELGVLKWTLIHANLLFVMSPPCQIRYWF